MVRDVYDIADKEGKKPPNSGGAQAGASSILRGKRVHEASAKQIQEIAERPEFEKRRRPPGKTLSSEKPGPRKLAIPARNFQLSRKREI